MDFDLDLKVAVQNGAEMTKMKKASGFEKIDSEDPGSFQEAPRVWIPVGIGAGDLAFRKK